MEITAPTTYMCLNIFCFIDSASNTFVDLVDFIYWYLCHNSYRKILLMSLTFSFSLAIEYSLHACVILSFFISFLCVHYLFIVYATMIWNQWMFLCSKDRPLHVWSKILQHVNDFVSPDSFILFFWVLIHTLKYLDRDSLELWRRWGLCFFKIFFLLVMKNCCHIFRCECSRFCLFCISLVNSEGFPKKIRCKTHLFVWFSNL